jgi:hypothetical protein
MRHSPPTDARGLRSARRILRRVGGKIRGGQTQGVAGAAACGCCGSCWLFHCSRRAESNRRGATSLHIRTHGIAFKSAHIRGRCVGVRNDARVAQRRRGAAQRRTDSRRAWEGLAAQGPWLERAPKVARTPAPRGARSRGDRFGARLVPAVHQPACGGCPGATLQPQIE